MLAAAGAPWVVAGCGRSPDYSILGSFFPAWIFCAVAGLLIMTSVRSLIGRTEMADHLVAPVLLYLSMAIFFACALWLAFFS